MTEGLELRRLLAATPINLAVASPVASGLPLPGLAYGLGLPTTGQASPPAMAMVSVAPGSSGVATASIVLPSVPSATGPATTLSPLMNDAETANAAASESARPRPGLSDRISIILGPPEFLAPIVHIRSPNSRPIVPGPESEPFAPDPLPVPAPAPELPPAPAEPAPGADAAPAPVDQAEGELGRDPAALGARDAALAMIAAAVAAEDEADAEVDAEASIAAGPRRAEAVLAAGALLAAWGGRNLGPRARGRSRRRALAIAVPEAGPGGPGR